MEEALSLWPLTACIFQQYHFKGYSYKKQSKSGDFSAFRSNRTQAVLSVYNKQ
jgi:hypothetical protein